MYLDHGVDPNISIIWRSTEYRMTWPGFRNPLVGFFGNLRSYVVDFSLLARIARDIPEANVVLIGDSQDSTAELEGIKNIHLLGKKSTTKSPRMALF